MCHVSLCIAERFCQVFRPYSVNTFSIVALVSSHVVFHFFHQLFLMASSFHGRCVAQVAGLFRDHDDLLKEFCFFLPDNSAPGGIPSIKASNLFRPSVPNGVDRAPFGPPKVHKERPPKVKLLLPCPHSFLISIFKASSYAGFPIVS